MRPLEDRNPNASHRLGAEAFVEELEGIEENGNRIPRRRGDGLQGGETIFAEDPLGHEHGVHDREDVGPERFVGKAAVTARRK